MIFLEKIVEFGCSFQEGKKKKKKKKEKKRHFFVHVQNILLRKYQW